MEHAARSTAPRPERRAPDVHMLPRRQVTASLHLGMQVAPQHCVWGTLIIKTHEKMWF